MELKRRRIIHVTVTDSPTDEWTAQQLREATAWGEKPKYLIRDRDGKYGNRFTGLAFHTGIQVLKMPFRTPKANVFLRARNGQLEERMSGSLHNSQPSSSEGCRQRIRRVFQRQTAASGENQLEIAEKVPLTY